MRELLSHTEVYHVLEEVGKGTFGTVAKCRRSGDGEPVAVKMLKFDRRRNRVIRNELKLIRTIFREDVSNCHIVRFFEEFRDQSHHYLVFELLDKSLHQLQKENGFRPMAVRHIRVITGQMLTALQKLKELTIIHADLKPENVMLVDHRRYPFRVKLIDFGSGSIFNDVRFVKAPYIQSRYYRSPEILLGLPFSERVDMWSLGCVMSELYLGWPLYPGDSEMEQVRFICETQGLPHMSLLYAASKTHMFFKRIKNSNGAAQWQLKTNRKSLGPGEVRGQGEGQGKGQESRKYVLSSLDQLGDMEPREREPQLGCEDAEAEEADRRCMVNLLKRTLTLDSNVRISPMWALHHPFLTLAHLSTTARFSPYHHNATLAMQQASVLETAYAPISRPVRPRRPLLPAVHPAARDHPAGRDHPNARPCFPGDPRSPHGASHCPREGPDEPSSTKDPQAPDVHNQMNAGVSLCTTTGVALQTQTQEQYEVQIPVQNQVGGQTQTTARDPYEAHAAPGQVEQGSLQRQPLQAPPIAGPPCDHHLGLGQPGSRPQTQGAKDQGAEMDHNQSASTEEPVPCGSEAGSTWHRGQDPHNGPTQRRVGGEEDHGEQTSDSSLQHNL